MQVNSVFTKTTQKHCIFVVYLQFTVITQNYIYHNICNILYALTLKTKNTFNKNFKK